MEVHVHGFGAPGNDCVVGDPNGGGVVSMDGIIGFGANPFE